MGKKLSFIESMMLMAGAGIGTGMLALPYSINHIGFFGTICALIVAYIATDIINIYIAELTLKSNGANEILGIVKQYLPKGKLGKAIGILFFVIISIVMLHDLIIYILCASDILVELFGISSVLSKIVFYIFASSVIMLGVKGIGVSEKYSVGFIIVVVTLLSIISWLNPVRTVDFSFGEPKLIFAVYGLFMFAFSSFFSAIQVANNIEDTKKIRSALSCGLIINAMVTLLFAYAAIIGSKEVTEVATIGITNSFGVPWIKIMCSMLVLLAVLSSFWSIGKAFTDMVKEQLKIKEKISWIICTIPILLIAIFLSRSIIDYLQAGSGILAVALGIMIIPTYYILAKNEKNELLLGKFGKSKVIIAFEAIAMIVMAVSSFIQID